DPSCPAAQMMMPPEGTPIPPETLELAYRALSTTAKLGWNPLLHDPRLERLLPRVTAPTLCLWGDDDRVVPPVYGEKFAALIPRARLSVVSSCGHLLPLEKPEAFLIAVKRFLEAEPAP